MKKQILSFALVATMIGAIAAGCSSTKKAEGADSSSTTVKDSSSTMTTTPVDTAKKDTLKTDTTKRMPPQK